MENGIGGRKMKKVLILNGSPHPHGFTAEDVKKDLEGLQTMRNLARNMSFLIKAISDAKEAYGYPEVESGCFTNFHDGK